MPRCTGPSAPARTGSSAPNTRPPRVNTPLPRLQPYFRTEVLGYGPMGVLDDAIREHLELKRQHGAAEQEVNRQEAEALGPVRRDLMAQPAGEDDGDVAETPAADAPPAAPEAEHAEDLFAEGAVAEEEPASPFDHLGDEQDPHEAPTEFAPRPVEPIEAEAPPEGAAPEPVEAPEPAGPPDPAGPPEPAAAPEPVAPPEQFEPSEPITPAEPAAAPGPGAPPEQSEPSEPIPPAEPDVPAEPAVAPFDEHAEPDVEHQAEQAEDPASADPDSTQVWPAPAPPSDEHSLEDS